VRSVPFAHELRIRLNFATGRRGVSRQTKLSRKAAEHGKGKERKFTYLAGIIISLEEEFTLITCGIIMLKRCAGIAVIISDDLKHVDHGLVDLLDLLGLINLLCTRHCNGGLEDQIGGETSKDDVLVKGKIVDEARLRL
jgi:hypothetical protein